MTNILRYAGIVGAIILSVSTAQGSQDSIYAEITLDAVGATGQYAPFMMRTRDYGRRSISPLGNTLEAKIGKDMVADTRLADYGFGVSALVGVDNEGLRYFMPELYVEGCLWLFDASIGIMPEEYGNHDCDLSSGGLLFSRNARSIPRATIGISEYRGFPGCKGYFEIKGGLSHGWLTDNAFVEGAYLHHKFIGGRIGGRLPVNLSYEFHHAAQWGGYSPVYEELSNGFDTFLTTFFGAAGGNTATDNNNAIGNHIGSHQMGLDIKVKDWKVSAYWQTLFEDGPIKAPWSAMNWPDGIWGGVIEHRNFPFLNKIVYEYINTTDQSGPYHDRDGIIFGGRDNYFRNQMYKNGWTFYNQSIGTPFITAPAFNTDGNIVCQNTRIRAHHVGMQGNIYGYAYQIRASHVENFGTYNIPLRSGNTSVMIEVEKHFAQAWGINVGAAIGGDFGSQFGNTVGIALSVSKRFDVVNY